MESLALQIDGKWAVLDDDVSISIEETSPIWGEGSSFSFPFELDVESNRHIIGNSDQITGDSVYKVLDNKEAVLYVLGIPLYYGKISLEDEVEINEGKIDVTLISSNLTFDEMIDGMNCQDVPLIDDIIIGEFTDECDLKVYKSKGDTEPLNPTVTVHLPPLFMRMFYGNQSTVNVSQPYPAMKYCNTRIAYQLAEKPSSFNDTYRGIKFTVPDSVKVENHTKGPYVWLGADRPYSNICFYLLYFIECLFKHIGIYIDLKNISKIEDMNRLAFFTTRCAFDKSKDCRTEISSALITADQDVIFNPSPSIMRNEHSVDSIFAYLVGVDFEPKQPRKYYKSELEYKIYKCIANSKNFPDAEVKEVLSSIENAFGVKFIFNKSQNECRAIFVKDVLKSVDVSIFNSCKILSCNKAENSTNGFVLKYSESGEDNTSYNYHDWDDVFLFDTYSTLKGFVDVYNKNVYVSKKTGNAYRVKVKDDATNKDELEPSLFEVASYNEAEYGDCTNTDRVEVKEIGFSPIILNDLNDLNSQSSSGDNTFLTPFIDVSMTYPDYSKWVKIKTEVGEGIIPDIPVEIRYKYYSLEAFDITTSDPTYNNKFSLNINTSIDTDGNLVFHKKSPILYENISPIQSFDSGLMIGVMRGPGNKGGVEDFGTDYDGENNSKYTRVTDNYMFSSDTVDDNGVLFDYNGEESGGVDVSGRISLKLRAEKPNPSGGFYPITEPLNQKRGLFDKFWSEYAYWVVNRKIIKILLRMEIADLVNIDWTIRYKIGNHIGFINKFSYSVNKNGLSDVELEMYYL